MQLACFAAAALYLELALIRFAGAEVLYLAYFSNFILITAFVGLGVGFLSAHNARGLDQTIPFALLFIFALVLVSRFDVSLLANHFGLFFFGNVKGRAGLPGAVLMAVLFLATAVLFAGIGERIGRLFAGFTPLKAYSLDVAGSLAGIGLFTIQSLVAAGPQTWVVTGLLLLCLAHLAGEARDDALRAVWKLAISGACIVVLLQSADTGSPTIWSTYQKLSLREPPGEARMLLANGVVHQFMWPAATVKGTYYESPYELAREAGVSPGRVLVIGAGTGTDVAVALANGAGHVDAVEIDGRIVDWGRALHPDAPFSDPRVRTYVTDGRKFLQDAPGEYDVVVFALPDSLTRISAMSSIRLESYLFTEEAFAIVRSRLAANGIFVLYNQYRWEWLVNKIAATAETAFGVPPRIVRQGETTVIAVGATLPGSPYSSSGYERLATDDWPFLYMQKPQVHWLHIGMIAMFLGVSVVAVRFLAPRGSLSAPDLPFFFMGVAFMLLETKSLAFFSLLFGTTWLVNSLAFAGILASVLAANLLVQRLHVTARAWLYGGLLLSLVLAYLLPAREFLSLDPAVFRYAAALVLAFAPIFFANLVFSREFRDSRDSARAFGWNLLGAVAGGGLEYFSLVVGFRDLLWIVALCYLLTAVFLRAPFARLAPA